MNWGCIPTKALLANAELYEKVANEAGTWGLEFDNLKVNWDKVIGRSRATATKLSKGISFLFKKNKIDHVVGHAKIISGRTGSSPCAVEIFDCEVEDTLTHAPATPAAKQPVRVSAN